MRMVAVTTAVNSDFSGLAWSFLDVSLDEHLPTLGPTMGDHDPANVELLRECYVREYPVAADLGSLYTSLGNSKRYEARLLPLRRELLESGTSTLLRLSSFFQRFTSSSA